MTLSAVARHEELERVACAELSLGVRKALPLFDAVNDGVARRTDVEIAIRTSRHWVRDRSRPVGRHHARAAAAA